MKKTIVLAAALVAMVGCNKSIIESPLANDADYGYINLGVAADTEMVVTKADEETGFDTYNIKLVSVSDNVETPVWTAETGLNLNEAGYAEYADVKNNTDLWKVEAGTYRLYIENLTVAETYTVAEEEDYTVGEVSVADVEDVTVTAGVSTDVELVCTPQNTMLSFMYTPEFDVVYDEPAVSVKESDSRTVPMTVGESHDEADAAYFEEGTLVWTLTAKLNGETRTYTKEIGTEKAKWSQVTFTTGSTDGQIKVTVTVDGQITEVVTVTASIDPISGEVTIN